GHAITENCSGGEATCVEKAICEVCDTVYGSVLSHNFDDTIKENVTVKEATCTENGIKTVKCSLCNEVESTVLPAPGHTKNKAVTENYVAASCTSEGSYDSVIYCAVCKEELSRNRVTLPIDKNGHVWNEWTVTTPATCTEDGIQIRFCTADSSHYETKIVAASGHRWSKWVTVTEATSASDGLERRTCLSCDEVEERVVHSVGNKNRQIQFVVADNMHVVVHMGDDDFKIYSKKAKAIYWYDGMDLNFEVVTGAFWKYDGYNVRVNGKTLQPNDDGTFTLPGGTGYAQINIYPVSDTLNDLTESGVCKYCGKVHPSHIWGRLVALFHSIFFFIKNLFNK
ncbi:MAG: hypothetical protein J1E34_03145, partial [Oscillospiraceae bacterium]|nr:hypothetical protein [Oscillospiraceae bacterium]